MKPSKVDWATPYDEWLIPILNRYRHGGAIECRAIPSEIQLEIEKCIAKQMRLIIDECKPEILANPLGPVSISDCRRGLDHYQNNLHERIK